MKHSLLIVGFLVFSVAVSAQKINKNFVDGEIYIKVKNPNLSILNSKKTDGVNVASELPFMLKYEKQFKILNSKSTFYNTKSTTLKSIYRIKIDNAQNIDDLLDKLKNEPNVEYVEKVPLRYIIDTPNDPSVGQQWFLNKIKAFETWAINAGQVNVRVAVVDNAIDTNHEDLVGNMLAGRDVSDLDNDPNPPNASFSHGTHVAGIVSAVSNNGIGVASASNNRIKIIPVKSTPDGGLANGIYHGYEGIAWAADNGAKIISLSWGGIGYIQSEQDVINYAVSQGAIVVAAAGNDNFSIEHFPSAYQNVIAVASLDSDDKKSSFSNFGTWVDIAAPGRGILSTTPYNTYASFNGTSMATPLVSSALGYLLACFPSLTNAQAEAILKNTADNLDAINPNYIGKLGAGRINMQKAIACPNGGLSLAQITANGSTYFCEGESVTLNANVGNGFSYTWRLNGTPQTGSGSSFVATQEGVYNVIISNAECSILSNDISIVLNRLKTPTPSVTADKMAYYCNDLATGNGFIVNSTNCNFTGPTTFTYSGGTVGYDAFEKSGPDPTVIAQNLGGTVSKVKVSITWQKKDGGNENSCSNADGGATPFNEELSFKLKSPSGKIITLLPTATYARGTVSAGVITTVFEDGAATIVTGSSPVSGTFAPNQALSLFNNEPPNGTWTLLAEDDSFADPLCVSGFSVEITTNAGNSPSTVTWWSAPSGGNVIYSGNDFRPTTSQVGEFSYFVQTQCSGLCPSDRVKRTLWVKSMPYLVAFPMNTLSSSIDTNKIKKGDLSQVNSLIQTNQVESLLGASLGNPITPCSPNQSYLILGLGCNGDIYWSNSQVGSAIIVNPATNKTYTANCSQAISCPPIASNPINFEFNPANINITSRIEAGSQQNFVSGQITANNKINTPAKIDYRASQAVSLNPGFSVDSNSVFRAFIGGCN
ncbi:MAG: S8 family serine peptidase [Spirosomataceae bacterium]